VQERRFAFSPTHQLFNSSSLSHLSLLQHTTTHTTQTHMQDLEVENARLQRIVDIVDSQPDLMFCTAGDGRVTFLSERMLVATKDFPAMVESKPITHVNQLFVPESVQLFFEAINQLNQEPDNDGSSNVKKVVFISSCGYSMTGGLRCAKVSRSSNHNLEEQSNGNGSASSGSNGQAHDDDSSESHPAKKAKTSKSGMLDSDSASAYLSAELLVDAAAVLSALPMANTLLEHQVSVSLGGAAAAGSVAASSKGGGSGSGNGNGSGTGSGSGSSKGNGSGSGDKDSSTSTGSNNAQTGEHEEEYVCVVRMTESTASNGDVYSSTLSKASMRDHDRSSAQNHTGERRGSPSSGSTGSGSSGSRDTGSRSTNSSAFPVSSNETTKNSTSSETGSEEEGEEDKKKV